MPEGTITAPALTPPATAASIAPGTGPATAEPAQAGSSLNDAFSALESRGKDLKGLDAERPSVAKPKVATKSAPAEKPVEKAAEKPAERAITETPPDKAATKPADAPKLGDKPAEGQPVEKPKPATGWSKFHEAEKQIKILQSKLEAKEKEASLPDSHPELVRMRGEIEKREKRLAEVENHLRYKDYEASTEYQDQYHKPYLGTAEEATKRATQLKVTNAETGAVRALTPEEFWQIVHIDDADAAINAAEKLFGEGSTKANFVIERRNEILLAHQRAEKAKADFKKNATELTRKQQEDFQRQGEERSALFKKLMTEGVEKSPELYKHEEGDAEGNGLLDNGFALVDRVFSGGAPAKEGEAPMSPQEMIAAHAQIRNDAAAFPRLAHKYKALQQRLQELEESLSEYEASTAGKGEVAAGEKGPQREDDLESVLSGLDKMGQ